MGRAKWMSIIVALALSVAVSASAAGSGSQNGSLDTRLDRYDITGTEDAEGRAAAAAERFTAQGFPTNAADLRVYKLGAEQYLVAPRAMRDDIRLEVFTDDAGKQGVRPVVTTSKHPMKSKGSVFAMSGWTQVAGQCWERTINAMTEQKCYKLDKYSDSVLSGGNLRDVFALHYWTVTNGGYVGSTAYSITQSWIKASRDSTSSSTMEWADWNPKTDSNGNCRNFTIGFSAGGFTSSLTGTVCEQWLVSRASAGGEMYAWWQKGTGSTMDAREVALGEEVYVPVGGWPVWNLESQWWYVVN